MEQITNVKDVQRSQTVLRLNADGTSRVEYKKVRVGDQVKFFLPLSEEAIRAMGKKKKHMIQFSGSVEIVEVLSPNNTTFRMLYQARHY